MIKDKAQLDEYFDLIKKSISLDMDDVAKILIRSYADKGWISNACSVPHAVDSNEHNPLSHCAAALDEHPAGNVPKAGNCSSTANDQCKSGEQAPNRIDDDEEFHDWVWDSRTALRTIYDARGDTLFARGLSLSPIFIGSKESYEAINKLLGVKQS